MKVHNVKVEILWHPTQFDLKMTKKKHKKGQNRSATYIHIQRLKLTKFIKDLETDLTIFGKLESL